MNKKKITDTVRAVSETLGLDVSAEACEKFIERTTAIVIAIVLSMVVTLFCAWYGAYNYALTAGFRAPTEYKPFVGLFAIYNFQLLFISYVALGVFYITFLNAFGVKLETFVKLIFRIVFPIALLFLFLVAFQYHNVVNLEQYRAFVENIPSTWLRAILVIAPLGLYFALGVYIGRRIEESISVLALPSLTLAAYSAFCLNHDFYSNFLASTGFGGSIEQRIYYKDNSGNCVVEFEGYTLMRTGKSIFFATLDANNNALLYEFRLAAICGVEFLSGIPETFDPLESMVLDRQN